MLLLHGDLPCLRQEHVLQMAAGLDRTPRPLVRLVPDCRGEGTNGLLCTLPSPIRFHYGEYSLAAHREACRRRQVTVEQMEISGMGLDVDTPDDLQMLLAQGGAGDRTTRFLSESDVPLRLRQMQRGATAGASPCVMKLAVK